MVLLLVKIKQFIVLDNAFVGAWHCSAFNLRRDQFVLATLANDLSSSWKTAPLGWGGGGRGDLGRLV